MSPTRERPSVLIVDDQPDQEEYVKDALEPSVSASVVHPQFLTSDELAIADLVLVDYRLDDWHERDELHAPSLKPMDGLALVEVLRSWKKHSNPSAAPTAFALRSAHLASLSEPLPPEEREHVIARLHNLEWVFRKADLPGRPTEAESIQALGMGVLRLPQEWPLNNSAEVRAEADSLLGLDSDETWYERAWETVQRCHPPLAELSTWSHGLAFLRWLLHRIFPYPTFLVDDLYLAARFHATVESIRRNLQEEAANVLLGPAEYSGVCSGLVGPRWWRPALEALLWDITDGNSFNMPAIHAAFAAHGIGLDRLDIDEPVVCLGPELLPTDDLLSAKDSVRLFPDDWPPFADLPWASIDAVRENAALQTVVLAADWDRVAREAHQGPS